MKTKKRIRVSFSGSVLEVSLPEVWSDLSQVELEAVYNLMASVPKTDLHFRLFAYFTGLRILRHDGDRFICQMSTEDGQTVGLAITPWTLSELLSPLSFVESPGDVPVRLDALHEAEAVDAELHGVTFKNYIALENLYQGFLVSKDESVLQKIASILYPGLSVSMTVADTINVLNWLVQIKANFSRCFPHFFRPVKSEDTEQSMSPLEVMNNEIRILTGGDVTKEKEILATDCWRALTELDFKAKEAAEMKERMKNK
ncbi:MAG: hypothetical protein NC212_10930 [Staphylococcus sp.]|nr:hypothetical protein [Staphylococcus sp.]